MTVTEIIKNKIPRGTVIPKPCAKRDFRVKGWGRRRGEAALIYWIPNHQNPSKPYEKGINIPEFETAYLQLKRTGQVTRCWFNQALPDCAAEGNCNFTTLGGVFELLGIARYAGEGVYTHTP